MALVFFGTPQFAVPSLKALIGEQEDIVLVVTQPDKAKGRGHAVSSPPVKDLAVASGLRVMQPASIKTEEFHHRLTSLSPEFIIVVAYGKILPGTILKVPLRGSVNVHASLLPKYRGAAPVQWSLINGGQTTGVTTMLMDEGLDTGPVLLQAEVKIGDEDTTETLSARLAQEGAATLIRTIRGMRAGMVKPVPQAGEPSYAPPLRKDDGRIDWSKGAVALFNLVRGTYPWPTAFCYFNGERVRLIKVRPARGQGAPGRIMRASGGELVVGTGDGLLSIEELQPEGKRIMPAAAFLAGRRLREGDDHFS